MLILIKVIRLTAAFEIRICSVSFSLWFAIFSDGWKAWSRRFFDFSTIGNMHGSRMTMRKIEILLLAKVELIVYLFISMNQSYSCWLAQLFWEHLFLIWISYKYIPRSCRFSGKKYNHVPKMNASHQWKLILNKRRKWSENECTIESITPQWIRQALDLAAFDFV